MPKIVSIVGTSNSGKTTLTVRLIAEFKKRGYRVGTIKHTHHPVRFGPEAKDSSRHQAAGAETVVLAGGGRIVMTKECPTGDPRDLLAYFSDVDILLTEGYKSGPHPKLEVHRRETGNDALFPDGGSGIFAFVSNGPAHRVVPSFGLEEIEDVADLIETLFLKSPQSACP